MRTATIYNFLLEANLMASIAIVLMLVVRKLLRRQLGNRAIYFAWLLVAIRLLCPLALPNPAINQIRPYSQDDQAIRPIAGQLKVRFADASEQAHRLASRTVSAQEDNAVAEAIGAFVNNNYNGRLSYDLMVIYGVGAGLVLCWFIIANLRFRHRLRADRIEIVSGKLLDQYHALCQERGVKPIPVYYTDPLPSACLVGTFRPYIALPLTAKPQEAIQVLTHEISHLKGRDNLWAVVRLLCCAIHWFNPLVWLAANMSRTDGELACDDRVVARLSLQEKMAYANVLVLAAARRNAPGVAVLATGMTMTGKKLKTRVNAILHSGQVKRGLSIAFVLLACMALVGAFATAEYKVWPEIPVYADAQPIQRRSIASDEEALAYAKLLWSSPYLAQDVAGAEWTVHFYDDTMPRYEVIAASPSFMGSLSVTFIPDGTVIYLNNGDCGWNIAGAAYPLYGEENPEKTRELHAYMVNAMNQLFGGTGDTVEAFRSLGDGSHSNNDQHFSSFYASDGHNRYAHHLVVQIVPEVRIVSYDRDIANEMMSAPTPLPAVVPEMTLAPTPVPAA